MEKKILEELCSSLAVRSIEARMVKLEKRKMNMLTVQDYVVQFFTKLMKVFIRRVCNYDQ